MADTDALASPGDRPARRRRRASRRGCSGSGRPRPGCSARSCSVDHKTIGKRYLVTAFVFLLIGGLEAAVMRAQLARPNQTLLTPEQYNQLFTMHGVTMIFLYALPVLSGFSNFLWPLLLGSRDMAFPRLNAFSYWVFLFAGHLPVRRAFRSASAPDAGWFNYVPYCVAGLQPGHQHRLLRARHGAARHLDDGRLDQLHRHADPHARARACRSTACRSWSGAR